MYLDLGIVAINFQPVIDYLTTTSPVVLAIQAFALVGWIPIVIRILNNIVDQWVGYKKDKLTSTWEYVVLAVDVPQLNVQTPKAVEQMFTHLSGAFDEPSLTAKFRTGYAQRTFSLEIISIEGYIQFLIRTEVLLRDLVEAAVYAQYPDAEITEVEDYVSGIPDEYPNDTYDAWGADFVLSQHEAYSIRSYTEFEHSIAADTVLKDPMGTFLESFSRIGPGEQMWFQIIIEPTNNSWKEGAIAKIKELLGEVPPAKTTWVDTVADAPIKFLEFVGDQVFSREASGGDDKGGDEKTKLAPGQAKAIDGMEKKIQKIGFKTMMRALYVARKEVFRPERGTHALIGAIYQYNVLNSNTFVTKTGGPSDMMAAYKKRKIKGDNDPYVLNIEELATVWHFPMSHVKTPLIQKTLGKHAEPPTGLPVEGIASTKPAPGSSGTPPKPKRRGYMTDAGYSVDEDDLKFG